MDGAYQEGQRVKMLVPLVLSVMNMDHPHNRGLSNHHEIHSHGCARI